MTAIHNCRIQDLGLISYHEAYQIQRKYTEEVISSKDGIIVLCEHPTVLTLGRMSDKKNILLTDLQIQEKSVEIHNVDRGGDITLHSPGQLIAYPILDLNYYGRDLHKYLRNLEQVGIELLGGFDIVASRSEGRTGIWVGAEKIISAGIGVKRWVSYHGLGINVNTDLELFKMIRPCGLNVEMTSMAKIKGEKINMQIVKNKLIQIFASLFSLKIV